MYLIVVIILFLTKHKLLGSGLTYVCQANTADNLILTSRVGPPIMRHKLVLHVSVIFEHETS